MAPRGTGSSNYGGPRKMPVSKPATRTPQGLFILFFRNLPKLIDL